MPPILDALLQPIPVRPGIGLAWHAAAELKLKLSLEVRDLLLALFQRGFRGLELVSHLETLVHEADDSGR